MEFCLFSCIPGTGSSSHCLSDVVACDFVESFEVVDSMALNAKDCLDLEMEIGIEEFERNLIDLCYCTLFFSLFPSCAFRLILFHFSYFMRTHQQLQHNHLFCSSTLELLPLLISDQSHILQFHNHIFQKVQINLPVKSPSEEITRLKRKVL